MLAVVLVAGLAFLYYKTDIGEFRRQVQIASYLRELKDIADYIPNLGISEGNDFRSTVTIRGVGASGVRPVVELTLADTPEDPVEFLFTDEERVVLQADLRGARYDRHTRWPEGFELDQTGLGGMMQSRNRGQRVTSKQLALGLNTMPADFVNAYVLGSLGVTGGVTGACATFLYNLRAAVEDIQSGRRRAVLVGSTEAPIIPEVIDGYAAMGALATDEELRKLDGTQEADYRRASRPFGRNCGFTLAESGQYIVLMDDTLALQLGAEIYGAVPAVYVNADGFKKSISAPGPGNCITMGKSVALARNLLGERAVQQQSFVQAHGSSTPQNRVTESRIFDTIAREFGIERWPVAAVKSYLGHSLGPASGDQMMSSLGVFAYGVLPGIKTIDAIAEDVIGDRLLLSNRDQELGVDSASVAFLNSKGFGGNNATATVLSPATVKRALVKRHGDRVWQAYEAANSVVKQNAEDYQAAAAKGQLAAIYHFGEDLLDHDAIGFSDKGMTVPGYGNPVSFTETEGYDDLI